MTSEQTVWYTAFQSALASGGTAEKMCDFADEVLKRFRQSTAQPEEDEEIQPRIGPLSETEKILTNEAMRVISKNLAFTRTFSEEAKEEIKFMAGETRLKIGDTIHVRKPERFVGVLDPGISMREAESR